MSRFRITAAITVIAMTGVLSGCFNSSYRTADDSAAVETIEIPVLQSLTGTSWGLVLDDRLAQVEGSTVSMVFDSKGIHGFAGCNGYAGSATSRAENQIEIGSLIATKKLCAEMDIETFLLAELPGHHDIVIDRDTLYLNPPIDSGRPTLRFVPIPET